MIEQNEKEIGKFFDECAQNGIMDSFEPEDEAKIRECLEYWNIQPGHYILEPGCGSGRLTEYLASAVGFEGKVYACDLSCEMIARAKKRNLPEQVIIYSGSVNSVPAADNYFDKVICFQVFPHFSDKILAMTEIARVLKPGGDLWINHLLSREEVNNLHRNASGVVISHKILPSDEMHRLLSDTGFRVVEIKDSSRGYRAHALKVTPPC